MSSRSDRSPKDTSANLFPEHLEETSLGQPIATLGDRLVPKPLSWELEVEPVTERK